METSSEAVWCLVFDPPILLDWPVNRQLQRFFQGRVALANHVYSDMVGVERDKLIGLYIADFLPLDNVHAIEMYIRADYRQSDVETVSDYAGGKRVNALSNAFPIIEGREVLRIWGTSREVTKHVEAERRFRSLTPREREVLALLTMGNTNRAIGEELGITERTVKAHRASVMKKLQLTSFADLVRAATENGWAQGQLIRRAFEKASGAA
jgi:PAS domain S-box-containing protein